MTRVIHADPDDWVEPNMIEELLANALETGADMVVCDYITERGSRQTYQACTKAILSNIQNINKRGNMFLYPQ